jgi:hypothetical protein
MLPPLLLSKGPAAGELGGGAHRCQLRALGFEPLGIIEESGYFLGFLACGTALIAPFHPPRPTRRGGRRWCKPRPTAPAVSGQYCFVIRGVDAVMLPAPSTTTK